MNDPQRRCRTITLPWIGVVRVAVLVAVLVTVIPSPGAAQLQLTRPDLSYRTFDTPHFRVVYAEGLREVAQRAAGYAEEGHEILRESFFSPPDGRIELLITDHTDLSNGFALVAPTPRIILWVRPPMDGTGLSQFDDWIRLVTYHELAHVFHLEQTGALGRAARRLFGRAPRNWPFFTGHLLPLWALEGVAVQVESAHTDGGRIHGTALESTARAQALGDGVESLGQALGRSPVWPGGNRPYVFGSLFFHWLDEAYGPDAVRVFLEAAAEQWIPFRLNAAARTATDRSLDELWEEWREQVARETLAEAGADGEGAAGSGVEYLTRGLWTAAHPAPRPGSDQVAYIRADGRSDTRLVLRDDDGGETTLALWNGTQGAPSWAPDGSLRATQIEFTDRWSMRRDLYRVGPDGGAERLTTDKRIVHADAHPETGQAAAVQEGEGTNRLVILSGDGGLERVVRDFDPALHWAYPRWSPDGTRLAVIRWRQGGWTGVKVLSPDGSSDGAAGDGTSFMLHEDRGVNTAPAWSPDGSWVLWAGDGDGALNLLAREPGADEAAGPLRQITRTLTGANHPAVDSRGRWIYFTIQDAQGWDLVRMPFEPALWGAPSPVQERFHAGGGGSGQVPAGLDPEPDHRTWSPFRSLLPRYWLPDWHEPESVGDVRVLPWVVGLETSGRDLVGRHSWALTVGAGVPDPGRRTELRSHWRWAGLGQPALTVVAEQSYRTLGAAPVPETEADTVYPVARERRVGLDADVVRQRARSVGQLSVGVREVRVHREIREADGQRSPRLRLALPERRLTELRGGMAVSTVRGFPFSISPEEGAALTVQGRHRFHRALADTLVGVPGVDGSFTEGLALARAFRAFEPPAGMPDFSRGGIGIRVAGGVASGPGAGARHFLVGGGGGGGDGFGRFTASEANPLFSVRGYPRGVVGGDRVWAASAEVRVPLANLHRGFGALPLHLDRMAAGLFVDAAGARGRAQAVPVWRERASIGVELSLIHSLFFGTPDQIRAGVALPLVNGDGAGVYIQSGWSF